MNKLITITCLLLWVCGGSLAQTNPSAKKTIAIEAGEKWYGGTVDDGHAMPFQNGYRFNLYGDNKDNQSAPLLLSTKGRYVWSDQPFEFTIQGDQLIIDKTLDSVSVVI